ncbi:filamentous hemagglutinin N-terminal domain-containing protein [Sphingomonas sp. R647]|uniref:beta strand repeat-containing protein n=1 Tax=Sphingomonas sp. R647 TaxID=2875233 RepID=UPI001CD310CD|nr:filamentous hemagglutinin N-terminal domain-containing protein [Sphingomonas sp. R647]MCA1197288.1 filamentous hemagglutinin N-terminal domain-containing protein [Sphingomonas sp. R647]
MIRTLSAMLLTTSAIVPLSAHAQSLPTGGTVVAGSAEIGSGSGGSLSIRQTSGSAIINWQSFNVDQGNRVDIAQPSSTAVLLNRVTGDTTSTIAGQVNANGRVFIINPNGILITASGGVKAAGFVGSTLDIDDADFLAGRYDFAGNGGSVVNAGRIEIARGGYAALIGGRIDNSGLILAPLGKVAMGAGTRAALDFSSDGFLKVAIGAGQSADLAMSGRITVDGGAVILSAAQAREAARSTVNLSGVIEARGIETRGGSVTLTGGDIALTGATIDVSGTHGGGLVKVGGDRQGLGTTAHADTLRVDAASVVRADATGAGTGGDIVFWSDAATDFSGTITARGIGAKGGEVEVSSKGMLGYSGSADLTGSSFGTLLLDPYNITISNAPSSGMTGFTAGADNSVLNASVLTAALATANVVVQTGSGGAQAGNITVAAPLTWLSSATLTLDAANNISLNSAITARTGGLILSAGGTISQTGAIAIGSFELSRGFFSTVAATLPDFEAGSFAINGGSYLRAIGGAGSRASPWLLTDIYGVQGMTSRRFSSYALANTIDASETVNWNGGAGFRPIAGASGTLPEAFFGGTLDGRGFAIENLYIRQPSYYYSGLFTRLQNATISNLRLTGTTIDSGGASFSHVAGLAPIINDSTIDNVHIDGRFTASGQSGIAAGLAHTATNATFTNVSVQGSISATDVAAGMVYILDGTSSIRNAYVTASATANNGAAGIVYVNYADTSIDSAWVSGLLTSQRLKAAIVIGAADGTIGSDVYWDIDSTTATDAVFFGVNGAVGLTSAQARTQAAYAALDFTDTWFQAADMRPILRSEAGAAGTDGYIAVSSLNQLQLVSANLGANYRLANDINAAAANGADASGIWGSGGFVPIGLGSSFSGNFDGDYHAISNLTIYRPGTDYVGLFSRQLSASPTVISNLRLINATVTGRGTTGALIGYSTQALTNIWVSGSVVGTSGALTGGVGGEAYGGAATNVRNVHFDGSVAGVNYVGGIFGSLGAHASLLSASGSVNGVGAIGGVIGQLDNGVILSASFSTASVTATGNAAGGIVGTLDSGAITNVWASGSVTAAQQAGGLAGNQSSRGSLALSYWDITSTGQSTAVGAGSGSIFLVTGLITAQARNPASYANFSNFNSVWYQGADMRPILRGEAVTLSDGTSGVFNARQLQLINANLSGTYTLLDDIDLSATNSTAGSAGIWGASGWVPLGIDGAGNVWGGSNFRSIGSITSGIYGFTGALYGGGYDLTGLYINRATIKNAGLFGVSAGIIDSVNVSGTVIGASGIGGLVGMQKDGTILDSTSSVNVSGTMLVGGLVGNQVAGSVIGSTATGTVAGTDDVGGLIGYAAGSIDRSYATGAVSGNRYVGGLLGYLYRGSVSSSTATGDVTASTHTAGTLVGKQDGGVIVGSTGSGTATAPRDAGGLVGQIVGGGTVAPTGSSAPSSGLAPVTLNAGRMIAPTPDADPLPAGLAQEGRGSSPIATETEERDDDGL